MIKRPIILFFLLLTSIFHTLANPIKESDALDLAIRFHQQRCPSKLRSSEALQLVYQGSTNLLRSTATDPAFYIYNIGDQKGFVIVSGEDAAKTILAYADEGCFRTDDMPENLKNWLNFYQQEIEGLRNASITTALASSEQVSTSAAGTATVAPLLGGIKWNQTDPYNLLCPWDATANIHTLAGCVAVAMTQIMDYYKWPVNGTGTHSYTDAKYGLQSVDFSKTTFDWSNMQDAYGSTATAQQDTAVETLVYQCGVAVNMSYSLSGSASDISKAAEAFVSHFGYDTDLQRYDRLYYSDLEWNTLIKSELNIDRPIFFSASSDEGGHAFVCDGYDSNNLFHINWGWGGSSNGYFELSALSSDNPGIQGATGGFCYNQSILANIHKVDAINKTSNQVAVYKNGLTASKSSISDISSTATANSFVLSFSFGNLGTNTVDVRWGIGFIKDGTTALTKLVENSTTPTPIAPGAFYPTPKTFTFSKPTGLTTAGTYRLYPIYSPKDSGTVSNPIWSIMHGSSTLNNCIIITVAGDKSATLLPSSTKPVLTLTKTPTPLSKLYQNKSVNVDITLQNTGPEFFSYLGLCLVSASNPNIRAYICNSYVCCPAGETKTFHLTGTVTSPPGNYYLKAMFDSTNSYSKVTYKTFSPTLFNSLAMEVLPTPGTPVLQLNNKITMLKGDTISKNDTVNLNASISNTGGYFDSRIIAFVFPKDGGQSLTYLIPQYVSIDSLETKVVTLTGTLDLNNGDYTFSLYHLLNENWTSLSPSGLSSINFTVNNQGAEISQAAETKTLFIHEDGGRLLIETNGEIRQSQLYDLSGRLVRKTSAEKIIQVGDLSPGVYLMYIQMNGKKYMERFLKH